MKFVPHDYQETTIDFLQDHERGLVILDMGLGKTVSSLTSIKLSMFPTDGSEPRYKRPLIIAPKIVSENTWANELCKWDHLKNLKYIEIDSNDTKLRLKQFDNVKDGVITIMSESKIQWLVDMLDNDMLEDNGREWPWDCVFIDEISLFKSPKSKRFQNLRKKLQNRVTHVYGLTGTPAPNDLSDLWAIMLLIDKGQRLGTKKAHFNKKYCRGIKIKIDGGNQEITNYKVAEEAYESVLEDIEDICIAMKAEDYLEDMPETTITTHEVKLPAETLKLIDDLTVKRVLQLADNEKHGKTAKIRRRIEKYQASGDIKKQRKIPKLEQRIARIKRDEDIEDITLRASHIFSLISIGRQLAGGAVYEAIPDDLIGEDGDEEELKRFMKKRRVIKDNKSKLETLRDIVDNADDNVLIFYHFKHEAKRIKKLYPDAKFLNSDNSQRIIPQWNSGNIRVLLANPASTKFGLNMQDGGHTIVWYGLDYSFEKYVQSNARLARQGQKHPVSVHVLAAAETIDIDIKKAIVEKSDINDFVYDSLGTGDKRARAELKDAAAQNIQRAFEDATGRRVKFK